MEIKDIDLTKCNNCRYKARIDGNEDYGRICMENNGLAFLRSDKEDGYIAIWHVDDPIVEGTLGRKVTDFEIVPRDPETYTDWQVGDKVNISDTHVCWEELVEVIFRSGELVVCKDSENNAMETKTCDQLYREGGRLILTDIERQIIEEKKYEPQDGDIVAWQSKENSAGWAISIYEEKDGSYMTLFTTGSCRVTDSTLDMQVIRPATDEEKQLLFDAMSKEGKRWNAERKVVEDIPKPHEFKKGEPVLVRTDYSMDWVVAVYVENSSNPEAQFGKYGATDGRSIIFYRFCLPYNERTMHLLGTSEDYKEE